MRDLGTVLMLIGGYAALFAFVAAVWAFLDWITAPHFNASQIAALLGLGAAFFLICGFGCVVASRER